MRASNPAATPGSDWKSWLGMNTRIPKYDATNYWTPVIEILPFTK
jgi:hypothetical protein